MRLFLGEMEAGARAENIEASWVLWVRPPGGTQMHRAGQAASGSQRLLSWETRAHGAQMMDEEGHPPRSC